MLADGDGTQLDFGPSTGTPTPAAGVFCQLTQFAGGGYQVTNAGPPESLKQAGNYSYAFNSQGQLLQIVDPTFNTQTLSYDGGGNLTQVLDSGTNKQITFVYSGGFISEVVESGGSTITSLGYTGSLLNTVSVGNATSGTAYSVEYDYNFDGSLARIVHDGDVANASTLSYLSWPSHDPNNPVLLARMSVPENDSGVMLKWGTGAGSGNNVRMVNVNGINDYSFSSNGDLQQAIPMQNNSLGFKVMAIYSSAYDGNHLLNTSSDGATTTAMSYFSSGLLQDYSDTGGRHTQFTFTGVDPNTISDNIGLLSQFGYTDALQPHIPTTRIDGNQLLWAFGHNAHGQTTGIKPPPGSPSTGYAVKYDENPKSSSFGYRKTLTVGASERTSYDAYDPLGDLLQLSTYPTAAPHTTSFAYDAAQRMTHRQNADGTLYQWVYNGQHLDHAIDEAGTQYNYAYCPGCGALEGISGPLGWAISWEIDSDHDMTSFTDARGATTGYAYASPHKIQSVTYPDQSQCTYQYDSAGRLMAIQNTRGQIQQLGYDTAGRLNQRTTSTGPIGYQYYSDDTLQQMNDGVGMTAFNYTPNRQPQSVTYDYRSSGLPAIQRLDYKYNPDNSRASLTWSSNGKLVAKWQYKYDSSSRLISVTVAGETTRFTYDGEGKLKTQVNVNGTTCKYMYNDARSWPIQIAYSRASGPFATYSLTYDRKRKTVGTFRRLTQGDIIGVRQGEQAWRGCGTWPEPLRTRVAAGLAPRGL